MKTTTNTGRKQFFSRIEQEERIAAIINYKLHYKLFSKNFIVVHLTSSVSHWELSFLR